MQKKFPKTYRNLYFDLDQTLWDFKLSSRITLLELCQEMFPKEIPDPEAFLEIYYPLNDALWVQYRKGELSKEVLRIKRFEDALGPFGVTDTHQINQFCDAYLDRAPRQKVVLPGTHEILSYLKEKGYRLYLLTNGFREVQEIKIEVNALRQYFERMITSDEIGYQKPNRKIFEYALKTVNAKKKESLMIGDDIHTDITGAKKFGMDNVYFNPQQQEVHITPTYQIKELLDLKLFL